MGEELDKIREVEISVKILIQGSDSRVRSATRSSEIVPPDYAAS
jgi:hypothetical protein